MRKMCVEVTTACCAACFTAGFGCAGGLALPAAQNRACCRAGRKSAPRRSRISLPGRRRDARSASRTCAGAGSALSGRGSDTWVESEVLRTSRVMGACRGILDVTDSKDARPNSSTLPPPSPPPPLRSSSRRTKIHPSSNSFAFLTSPPGARPGGAKFQGGLKKLSVSPRRLARAPSLTPPLATWPSRCSAPAA